jgi:hypothetical protein
VTAPESTESRDRWMAALAVYLARKERIRTLRLELAAARLEGKARRHAERLRTARRTGRAHDPAVQDAGHALHGAMSTPGRVTPTPQPVEGQAGRSRTPPAIPDPGHALPHGKPWSPPAARQTMNDAQAMDEPLAGDGHGQGHDRPGGNVRYGR